MSIRIKILVTITITSLLLLLVLMLVSFNVVLSGFNKVEQQDVERNISRVNDAFNSKTDEIATKLYDWSQWDDSYKFMQDQSNSFIKSNLTDETFSALKINTIVFVDNRGHIVYSKFFNFETKQEEPLPVELKNSLQKGSILFDHPDTNSVVKGVINLRGDDLLVATRPIVTSKGKGPILGTLLFGRLINADIEKNLSDVTHLSLSFIDVNRDPISQSTKIIEDKLISKNSLIVPVNNNIIAGYTLFYDINKRPVFFVMLEQSRDIFQQGQSSIYSFFVIFSILTLIFCTVILFLLDKLIISRLYIVSEGVKKISTKLEEKQLITLYGNDELSRLAHEINTMVEALQLSNTKIKEGELKIKEEAVELENKNSSLQKSESTLIKVMEDLKETKSRIESEKIRDEVMLESIGEGLIVTDKNGVVIIINRAIEQMLGFSSHELIGKRLSDQIILTDESGIILKQSESIVDTVLTTGEKLSKVYYFSKKDGATFPSAVTTSAVIMNEEIIGAISVLRDITKEKEIDRMKSEFISLASHQLRAPLTAIKWFTEAVLGSSLDSQQKEYLSSIHNSNEKMIDLVNSLLNISRIESGRINVCPIPTNLPELIEEVKKDLIFILKEKNITLTSNFEKNIPLISTDPKLLRNIYLNLLSNAVKYSPENSVVTLNLSIKDDGIISEVVDQGYGIPPAQQDKIYQKFFRAENVMKKETDGTGLGLYLVKSLVELLEGKIWFKSIENKGTVFWFSLPLSGIEPRKGEVSLN